MATKSRKDGMEVEARPEVSAVLAVFDDLLLRVHNISLLGPALSSCAQDQLEQLGGIPFAKLMGELLGTERLVDEHSISSGEGDRDSRAAMADQQYYTKSIARYIVSDAQLSRKLMELNHTSEGARQFVETLAGAREMFYHSIEILQKGLPAAKESLDLAMRNQHREMNLVAHLEEKIRRFTEKNQALIKQKDSLIESMKQQIDAIEHKIERQCNLILEQQNDYENRTKPKVERDQAQFNEHISLTNTKFSTTREQNIDAEVVLRRKKHAAHAEHLQSIALYDQEMIAVYERVQILQSQYDQAVQRRDFLGDHFQRIDEERARKAEAERKRMLREKRLKRNIYLWYAAAILVHKNAKKHLRKKKGKGAGSKGKKGKKGKGK